jgi:hypothetical protein
VKEAIAGQATADWQRAPFAGILLAAVFRRSAAEYLPRQGHRPRFRPAAAPPLPAGDRPAACSAEANRGSAMAYCRTAL